MRNSTKTFCKQTIPLFLLLVISFFALPAHAKYGGGTGEPNDPYLIYDANHMNAIGADTNDWDKHFKLMSDIGLGAYTGTQFNIIGNNSNPFSGVFDGNGHTISNFTYDSNDTDYIGLFGFVDDPNAEIKNLGLIDPNVNAGLKDYVGPLVGLLGYYGTITNCYVRDGSVAGNYYVGGLAGHNIGTISNCYSESDVSGVELVGGLVGRNSYYPGPGAPCFSGKISNCYSTGSVTGDDFVGGLAGWDDCGEIIASFWDVNTSGQASSAGGTGKITSEMQTESTFTDAGWDFVGETANGTEDIWRICEGEDYPRLSWEEYEKYGGGTGEPNDPYLIFDANQMNAIGADANDWDKHFKLMADIDLSGYTGTEFNIIGAGRIECDFDLCWFVGTPFTGVFDGNGHTISNFTYEYIGDEFVGLFGHVMRESAQIKNLFLRDVDIDVQRNGGGGDPDYGSTGSLIGELHDGTVIGCYIQGGNISGGSRLGGMVGANYGTIANCHSSGNFEGEAFVGGLVGGTSQGTITNCYSTGSVSGGSCVGGLAGGNFGNISDCYATGSVSGDDTVGGLVGRNGWCIPEYGCYPGTISNCYSAGSVSGDGDVGGLVGINEFGMITDSFWDTDISDVNNMCGSEGSGGSGCDNGNGKSTAQMQTESTFTDAGWDFVGETVNGPNDIWDICEGTNYPNFLWQIPIADFICPDGVNFFDFSFFASQWAEDNCAESNDCDGRDLDLLGSVDIKDLRIFADNWLSGL